MDKDIKEKERRISLLQLEDEELGKELSVEQKKAAIAEAKKLYGRDWKKILFGAIKGLKVNKENLQTLHGLGVNSALREMNDPRALRKSSKRLFEE